MLKNKKSLAVILSLVMLLAMACGAWAADAIISADNTSKTGQVGPINVVSDSIYGLWARNDGYIEFTGDITTNGDGSHAVFSERSGDVKLSGNINTSGWAHGLFADQYASIDMEGDIECNGTAVRGLNASRYSLISLVGNVDVSGDRGLGAYAQSGSTIKITGDVSLHVPGVEIETVPGVKEYGYTVAAIGGSSLDITGNVSASGEYAFAIWASDGTITMRNGNISGSDAETATAAIVIGSNGVINLSNVTTDEDTQTLLALDKILSGANTGGTLNVSGESTLFGDIVYDPPAEAKLEVNLTDSAWSGAATAIDDIGSIDITLVGSNWNITGDSNTNGTVTGDGNSSVSYTLSPEETTAIIDRLIGNPNVDMKIGDRLIIRNSDTVPESSNPDVVEIVVNEDGSVEIISKGDGEATLTYHYLDENNKIQTATIKIVSGAGSEPESNNYGGGGSSNCNAGMGIGALVSLLGLALVMRKK